MMAVAKKNKVLLLFSFLFLSINAYSQYDVLNLKSLKFTKIKALSISDYLGKSLPTTQSIMYKKAVFSAKSLPLFCKIEHSLLKKSQFPVKIRLGDIDYVNKLEGKN